MYGACSVSEVTQVIKIKHQSLQCQIRFIYECISTFQHIPQAQSCVSPIPTGIKKKNPSRAKHSFCIRSHSPAAMATSLLRNLSTPKLQARDEVEVNPIPNKTILIILDNDQLDTHLLYFTIRLL